MLNTILIKRCRLQLKSVFCLIFTDFLLLGKWRRYSASSLQQIFPEEVVFPKAINFPQEINFPNFDTKYCSAI